MGTEQRPSLMKDVYGITCGGKGVYLKLLIN
jgi:hypothetical protein